MCTKNYSLLVVAYGNLRLGILVYSPGAHFSGRKESLERFLLLSIECTMHINSLYYTCTSICPSSSRNGTRTMPRG